MRLTRTITTMNWRYAVGEVFLIVVGISIALGANAWWENRQERLEERAVLATLKRSLQVDLQEFEENQRTHLDQESNIITLVEHMEGVEPYYPGLNPYFRSVRTWRGVTSNTAPYEALKSRGFALISDENLRNNIIYYYENLVHHLTGAGDNDRTFVTERVNPYTDRYFLSEDTIMMVPLDYESVRKDVYYRNLCLMKLFRLQTFILPQYQQTNKLIRDLIEDIDTKLGDTT